MSKNEIIYMFTCDLFMSTCNIIMLICNIIMLHVTIFYLHINIIMLHVAISFVVYVVSGVCRGLSYTSVVVTGIVGIVFYFDISLLQDDDLDYENNQNTRINGESPFMFSSVRTIAVWSSLSHNLIKDRSLIRSHIRYT